VSARRVQVDEIWSFTYAKAKNVAAAKKAPAIAGDTWTWTAIEAEHTLLSQGEMAEQDPKRLRGAVRDD